MPADFDRIAPNYDLFARLVFGNAVKNSQLVVLDFIPDQSAVLIVGGGTGWLLKALLQKKSVSKVVYIEASARMLELSRKQALLVNYTAIVDFRLGTEKSIQAGERFDVVITHFLLDVFTAQTAGKFIQTVGASLQQQGIWLCTDFSLEEHDSGKWWKKTLIRAMYAFFRWTCHIEATRLPPLHTLFAPAKWQCVYKTGFYNNLIVARIYRKLQA